MNDKSFIEEVCCKCKNKFNNKDLCYITKAIDGKSKCVNYEKIDNKNEELKIWNYEKHKYEKYRVPVEWNIKIYTNNMEEVINCVHCGKKVKAGDSYSSYEIHNNLGIGYCVCEKCFEKEMMRRKNK